MLRKSRPLRRIRSSIARMQIIPYCMERFFRACRTHCKSERSLFQPLHLDAQKVAPRRRMLSGNASMRCSGICSGTERTRESRSICARRRIGRCVRPTRSTGGRQPVCPQLQGHRGQLECRAGARSSPTHHEPDSGCLVDSDEKVDRAKQLLSDLVGGDLAAVHAIGVALHNIVNGVNLMRELYSDSSSERLCRPKCRQPMPFCSGNRAPPANRLGRSAKGNLKLELSCC